MVRRTDELRPVASRAARQERRWPVRTRDDHRPCDYRLAAMSATHHTSPTPATASLLGIHHVTAFAKSPQENLDFYTRVLGLRCVKRTVNFDDPGTYHLYYGDAIGSPGTLITHFPHPQAARGRNGTPEIAETLFAIPEGSIDRWAARLRKHGVTSVRDDRERAACLRFDDPDAMHLGVVEIPSHDAAFAALAGIEAPNTWRGAADAEVDQEMAILGVDSVVLHVPDLDETSSFLSEALGFTVIEELAGGRVLGLPAPLTSREATSGTPRSGTRPGARLELIEKRGDRHSNFGAGSVHHVAWRVHDERVQAAMADRLRDHGVAVTRVMDRQYFRSIYFRIPAGIVFEIATDGPGFAIDETPEQLGAALRLPPSLESRRAAIEAQLVPLTTPENNRER